MNTDVLDLPDVHYATVCKEVSIFNLKIDFKKQCSVLKVPFLCPHMAVK